MPNPDHPYFQLIDLCRQYQATLVAVSKTRTIEEIQVLYDLGQRIFAENRTQELATKAPAMPGDIEWHLIGHLQTNKVRSIMPYVTCVQSLDSAGLWDKIQKETVRHGKNIRCLLQVKVAKEETKYGWDLDELDMFLSKGHHLAFPDIILTGVMGMASLTEDIEQVRDEMKQLKNCFDHLKANYFKENNDFKTISMGMSGDYQIALQEGSTMIRIGSLLFPK